MKPELNISLSFNQILGLVRQLPKSQKIRLTQELEKEGIESQLSVLLEAFKSDELSTEAIDKEVEHVRKAIYEESKKN